MPTHQQMSAPVHSVAVAWRLANTRDIVVGPEPTLVLACRALRDVEVLHLLVSFPEFLNLASGASDGPRAESVLAQVPHVVGLRRLLPEGEPWVRGQEDVIAQPMISGKPEDLARAPAQVRWYGDTVDCFDHNVCAHPYDYWCWRGRIAVPAWASLGVIVRASKKTICRVKTSGV